MASGAARALVAEREGAPTASVVLCTYSEARWPDLVEAVDAVRRQTVPAGEILIVVDHNPELLARARRSLGGAIAIPNTRARGLAGARNSGVAAATGSVIAFLDDDAVPEPDWLERLLSSYSDPAVIGNGGWVEPWWLTERPRWFPDEFDWVVGCSYRGLPAERREIRNPIGANMSFRRDLLERVGGFREDLGRIGALPVGCEETELSIRAAEVAPGGRILFEPGAEVRHRVPSERGSASYFASRCFSEGLSKAVVSRSVGREAGLASERAHVVRSLPRGIGRGLAASLRGDRAGALRALAIAAGLVLTIAGYLVGSAREIRRPA